MTTVHFSCHNLTTGHWCYRKQSCILLEQSPAATGEAAILADRQFWRQRGDKVKLRRRSMFLATDQSQKL